MVALGEDPRTRRRRVVGNNIRLGREFRGLTQETFAHRLDRPRPQVSDWERGIHEPGPESLARIGEVLDLPESYFFQDPDA